VKVLVLGAGGQLGHDVAELCTQSGDEVRAVAHADLDVTDRAAVHDAVEGFRPAVVVNAAAWTAVDACESDPDKAYRVNALAPRWIAQAARSTGAYLCHVSTDYVFDGTGPDPYEEDDPPSPRSAYGRSKLAGELAVSQPGGSAAIVRSSWLFGPHGRNFVDTMCRLGAGRDEVAVVDDQVGCPTYTGHLAPALVAIAENRLTDVLHVAGGGHCTWFELAMATFAEVGLQTRVRPQTTAALGRPAPRPAFSALASTRGDAPVLPPWREGLRAHLARVEVTA
jgi:dTDP-4-dehydrorhamnose reductase